MVRGVEASEPAELLRVGGDWYVHAASALADDRTRVLKDGETFAILDRYGDIQPIGLGEQGIFHGGTRHLSQFTLRIGGKRPLLLSSTVSEDNCLLTVDLANVELEHEGVLVAAETLHVLRTMFLWDGVCYQRLDLRNYAAESLRTTLTCHLESDFRDLFEVRGMRRPKRGELARPVIDDERMRLAYAGLDGVTRSTELDWSVPPLTATPGSVEFDVQLAPGEARSICLRIDCRGDRAVPTQAFDAAFHRARTRRQEALDAMCMVETSNERFNEWLNRSRSDLLMLTTETEYGPYPYAGTPWFSTAFGRDGIIAALEALWLNPSFAAGVLRFLAATQALEFDAAKDAAPGKILHETRNGEMAALGEVPFARYYGTVDATPLFVVLAGAYFEVTGNRELIAEIWKNIEGALRWIDETGDSDGDGFVDYFSNPQGLINQGWKDSEDSVFHADGSDVTAPVALCEVQAYVFAAKQAAARLADVLDRPERAIALRSQAEALRARFAERFWVDELGTFALALDGDDRRCAVRSSNAGHALFGGIATADHARQVAAQLTSDSSFSGWGVRTIASTEARYNPMSYHNGSVWPHDNALIADGLARYGYKAAVLRIVDGMFTASQALELNRLPELICGFPRRPGAGPTIYSMAAAPQAWASGAVFLLLRACLGLTADALRNELRFDHPVLPDSVDWLRIRGLRVGEESIDFELHRHPDDVGVVVLRRTGDIRVISVK